MPKKAAGTDVEYELHREAVLGMLAKRFPRFAPDQRLELYHEAWARALKKRRSGEELESLRAFLMQTAAWEAMHIVSHGPHATPVDPTHPAIQALVAGDGSPEESVLISDQARICREVIDSLGPRHRAIFKLRWDSQLSPTEIRARLRLTPRQYKRLASEGAEVVALRVAELQDGTWSLRQRSLLAACLRGVATEEQRSEARRRVRADPHVAALCCELTAGLHGNSGAAFAADRKVSARNGGGSSSRNAPSMAS